VGAPLVPCYKADVEAVFPQDVRPCLTSLQSEHNTVYSLASIALFACSGERKAAIIARFAE